MKTKTVLKTILIGAIATIISTGCKKDKSDPLTTPETQNITKDLTALKNSITTYRYWITTEIITDKAIDLYGKGATKNLFSQRPDHQTDYFIEVSSNEDKTETLMDYKLHFGSKKLPKKSWHEEGQFRCATNPENNNKLFIDWIQPYIDPKYTFEIDSYYIESLKDNVLKLYSYDSEIETTVHLTFIGSNTKPF